MMELTSHPAGHVNLHIIIWDSNNAYAGQSQGQYILLNALWLLYCT